MKMNRKENKTTNFVKGVLFVAFLGLASGCGGGSNPGQSLTADNSVRVNSEGRSISAVAEENQLSTKMDLCAEVNGWATDCRFVGMKYLKMNENIVPLTENFKGNKGRGGQA